MTEWIARTVFHVALAYLAFLGQTCVVPRLGCGGLSPHVVLAGMCWMVWRSPGGTGLFAAALWGLVSDGLSRGPLGVDVIGFAISAWLLQSARERWRSPSALALAALVGCVACLELSGAEAFRLAAEGLSVEPAGLAAWSGGHALGTALTTLLAVRLFQGARTSAEFTGPRPVAPLAGRWSMLAD